MCLIGVKGQFEAVINFVIIVDDVLDVDILPVVFGVEWRA